MKQTQIVKAIRDIVLALNMTNNCITTDVPGIEPKKDYSWRVDHSKELAQLDSLERLLMANTDICPLCGHCNKYL